MAFCGKCGTEARGGAQFCSKCGEKLIPTASPDAAAPVVAAPPIVVVAPVAPPPPAPPVIPMAIGGGFCSSCGRPVGTADGFCKSCGAPLGAIAAGAVPPVATSQVGGVPPVAVAPVVVAAAAAPPPRKSHTGLWIVLVLAIVFGVVALMAVISVSGPKPEDAVDGARTAYLDHDQANFDKYVDVHSVLSDGTDQAVNEWLRQNNTGALGTMVVQTIAAAVKNAYLQSLSQSVDQWVVSGSLSDQPQSSDSDSTNAWVANFVSNGLRTLAASQLSYQGVASKSVSDTTADLDLNMGTSLSSGPITVRLRLVKDGDHWRIVSIEDLPGLLKQLNSGTH